MSKFVYTAVTSTSSYDANFLRSLIKRAIERNFNGAAYLFGENQNEIGFEKVPGLVDHANVNKSSDNYNNLRVEDIGNPYGQNRADSPSTLNIFSSAQIFK